MHSPASRCAAVPIAAPKPAGRTGSALDEGLRRAATEAQARELLQNVARTHQTSGGISAPLVWAPKM